MFLNDGNPLQWTITDTQSNTWTQQVLQGNGTGSYVRFWTAQAGSTGACTVSGTSAESGISWYGAVLEYTCGTHWQSDSTASAQGSSSTPSSGSVKVSTDSELVLSGILAVGTYTSGSGFTNRVTVGGSYLDDMLSAASGTADDNASTTQSAPWAGIALSVAPRYFFNQTGSGGAVVGGAAFLPGNTFNITASGGAITSGYWPDLSDLPPYTANPTASGGALTGGSALLDDYIEYPSGGAITSGDIAEIGFLTNVPIYTANPPTSGDPALCGGSALIGIAPAIGGGALVGGAASFGELSILTITVPSTSVTANLTGFPLKIQLTLTTPTNYPSSFYFTDVNGNKLGSEIEYSDSQGHLIAFINTNLSDTSNTVIYGYYST